MTYSKREVRTWWTDGEYISNHMDETEEQLLESDFFQVVEKSEFDALVNENAELVEALKEAIKCRDFYFARVWPGRDPLKEPGFRKSNKALRAFTSGESPDTVAVPTWTEEEILLAMQRALGVGSAKGWSTGDLIRHHLLAIKGIGEGG